MMLVWLISNILWASLTLLLASALTGWPMLAGLGWIFFGAYLLGQPGHYLAVEDYFNILLFIGAGLFCFYLAWIILTRGGSIASDWITRAAAICGAIYYPFAEVEWLKTMLIGATASITAGLLSMLSIPVYRVSWNTMNLNGSSVEIILACTAIESIALFAGIILSVRSPLTRKLFALIVSTFTIYLLNILRNAFVLVAFGEQWFGSNSFFLAHNVIAKVGSTLALLVIAYFIFSVLPELLTLIDQLAREIRHPGGDSA